MRVAVIQLKSTDNKEKNINKALCLIKCAIARKAKFIALPEAFHCRAKSDPRKGFSEIAEDIPGFSTKPLTEAARTNKVAILAGSIAERIPGKNKVYNASVLIDSRGNIVAKYRKNHLFDANIQKKKVQESKNFVAGNKRTIATVGSWKVGLSICYDLRFPSFYQEYKKKGVEILCVPSAFTKVTGRAHWGVLVRARAIENTCYVLAPNQAGKDSKGIMSYGNSLIVDPWGKVLARASADREEILFAELEKHFIKDRRKILGT